MADCREYPTWQQRRAEWARRAAIMPEDVIDPPSGKEIIRHTHTAKAGRGPVAPSSSAGQAITQAEGAKGVEVAPERIGRSAVWGLETPREATPVNAGSREKPAQVLLHGIWPGIQRPIGMSAEGGKCLPNSNSASTSCPSADIRSKIKGGGVRCTTDAGDTTGPDCSQVLGAEAVVSDLIAGLTGSRNRAARERRPAPTNDTPADLRRVLAWMEEMRRKMVAWKKESDGK
jgi:hypothetical protein